MIKINKSYGIFDIPESLREPVEANFKNGVIVQARTTQRKREELLVAGGYIDDNNYNNRYKLEDVRSALNKLYHSKCAFCEQKIEQYHIEHYRPKNKYYWLAYSWDNLLIACPKCNENKGVNISIGGISRTAKFPNVDINLQSDLHDEIEQPFFVNPEITDPDGFIYFHKDGRIDSDNPRFCYTIWTCKIDRTYLNDERSEILDDFKKKLRAEIQDNLSPEQQIAVIGRFLRHFKIDAENPEKPFLAFRKYVLEHWLREEIKAIFAQ